MLPTVKIPVIAVANQKGGVGKTTCTSILAEWMAYVRKKRVLLIDMDMQCNTSEKWVGMDSVSQSVSLKLPPIHPEYNPQMNVNERSSVADIYWGKSVLPYTSWLNEQVGDGGSVDVLMGHPELLEEVSIKFAHSEETLAEKVHNQLRRFLASDDLHEYYDIVFLDTGPSRTPVFRSAIRAASHVVIPFGPEENDFQGIVTMLQVCRRENYQRSKGMRLSITGLLPNKVRLGTLLHKKNLSQIVDHHSDMLFPLAAWLPLSTRIPERDVKDSRPKTVFELKNSDPARISATFMAMYFEQQVFGEIPDLLNEKILETLKGSKLISKLDDEEVVRELQKVFNDKGRASLGIANSEECSEAEEA